MGRIILAHGNTYHVGSRRRPTSRPMFHFGQYIDKLFGIDGNPLGSLPNPPAAVSYTGKAMAALKRIYKNNLYGWCVPAGLLHLKGIWTGNADTWPGGQQFTDAQLLALYTLLSGGTFTPDDPNTDNGCDEMTALNILMSQGFPDGEKPIGYMRVDGANWEHVKLAIWLFEGLLTGCELPDECVAQIPAGDGFVWDASGPPDPGNGHCMALGGYDSDTAEDVTWGLVGRVTKRFIGKYMVNSVGGELYAILTPSLISRATAKAANGFDFDALKADMATMRAAA